MDNLLDMAELPELTIEDLMDITWDYSKSNILGTFKGTLVKGWLFEVICSEVNPEAVTRCNVKEGWVEHVESTTPFGNMQQIFEHAIKDDAGNPIYKRVNCKVMMKLMNDRGDFITVLKGKEYVGDVDKVLGT